MVRATVVVCTRNRADSLRRTLASLASLASPDGGHEVLVVDNGSTDHTADVVGAAASSMPGLRAVVEPEAGLSRARNRGIAEAAGEIVAFIDDDAEPDASWLLALCAAYDAPSVGAAGGRVDLVFDGGRPPWLPRELEGHFAGIDLGPDRVDFRAPKCPYGTNMSLRRTVFDEVGGFDPDLGRRGTNLISNEEVELFDRVRAAGHRIVYEPGALVHHHVEGDRAQRGYLLRRAYAQGASRAIVERGREADRPWWRWARQAVGGSRKGVFELAGAVTAAARTRAVGVPAVTLALARAANGFGYAARCLRAGRA